MSAELLEEFKRIYLAEFGEELSDQEVLDKATAVVGLFRAIYRAIPLMKKDFYKSLETCYDENEQTQP